MGHAAWVKINDDDDDDDDDCNQPDGRHIRHTEGLIFSFVVLFAPVIGILEVSSMHSVVTCLVVNLL